MVENQGRGDKERRTLRERFPALDRLEGRTRQRHVPYVQQLHMADCGAACMTMVLRFFGRGVRLDEVRERLGLGRDGVTVLALIEAARFYGLRGRAVRLDLEDLDYLPRASILHWRMDHFVVLDKIGRKGVTIVDPAGGRRVVPMEEFSKNFTGVALTFEPTNTFERTRKDRSLVWGYIGKILTHSGLLTRIVTLSVFAQVFGLALPIFTGAIVDRVVPRGDVDLLVVIASGIAAIAVFNFLSSLIRAHLMLHLRTNLDVQMTLDFLSHMMRLPFSFFQVRQTGDLMMRLNSNTTIRETLTSSALTAVLDGTLVCSYLVVLLLVHFQLGLIVVGLGALRMLIYFFTRRSYRELMTADLHAQAESSNYQVQMISGIESIKAAGAEQNAVQYWSNLLVDVMNVAIKRGRLSAIVQASLGALGTVSPLVLLGYGAHLVLSNQLSLGTMLAMNALAGAFLSPLSSLVSTALELQNLGSYVDRVEDVLERDPEQAENVTEVAPRLDGRIELRDVSFAYSDDAPFVIENLSLVIEAGATVAIVGRTGSGKSTLARLIVGLIKPTSGEILYDDRSLGHVDLQSFRRQFGFVPQDPYLFSTTIRNNIAIADPELPFTEITRAARMACIHDDIVGMPMNYNTVLAPAGASLSGGQRQRIALARALAGNPSILVLDEATSHLDAVTESMVRDSIKTIGCTRVVIAHRLSTVVDADQVLVIDQGQIVEQGSHDTLLDRKGAYAHLVQSQMRGTDDHDVDP